MFTAFRNVVASAAVAGLVLSGGSTLLLAQQVDEPIAVSPEASKVIGEYLAKVSGRFGALAISPDGKQAAYYICQSRLWKNCDDYGLEDSSMAIPSGQLAAKLANQRCRGYVNGGCVVLFVNSDWKYQFTLAQ